MYYFLRHLTSIVYREYYWSVPVTLTHATTCEHPSQALSAALAKKSLNVKILCCCKAPLSTRFIIYPYFPSLSLSLSLRLGGATYRGKRLRLLTRWGKFRVFWSRVLVIGRVIVGVSDTGGTHIKRTDVTNCITTAGYVTLELEIEQEVGENFGTTTRNLQIINV